MKQPMMHEKSYGESKTNKSYDDRTKVTQILDRRQINRTVLSVLQSGLVPGDLTVNQLVDIYNTFCKSLDEEGKEVRAVFCDISKAFDRL